jgi:hypothetical protein
MTGRSEEILHSSCFVCQSFPRSNNGQIENFWKGAQSLILDARNWLRIKPIPFSFTPDPFKERWISP